MKLLYSTVTARINSQDDRKLVLLKEETTGYDGFYDMRIRSPPLQLLSAISSITNRRQVVNNCQMRLFGDMDEDLTLSFNI